MGHASVQFVRAGVVLWPTGGGQLGEKELLTHYGLVFVLKNG